MSDVAVRPMAPEDWPFVSKIYLEGIATEHATFQTACPPYTAWDAAHTKDCRLVVLTGGAVAGWAALHRVDPRWCYRGVAEVSIYVGEQFRGRGVGYHLLNGALQSRRGSGLLDAAIHRFAGQRGQPARCTRNAVSGWWAAGSASPATAMAAGWTPT